MRPTKALIAGALLLSSIGNSVAAQPKQSAPAEPIAWLQAQRSEITHSGTAYSGPGLDRLIDAARTTNFFMIGEQHASGSIAKLETAIHDRLVPLSYDYAALEVGPFSTQFAERTIRSRPGALGAFLKEPGNGFSIPFLFVAEETAMAEQIVGKSRAPAPVLWGVDQEFIGGAPIVTDFLERRAKTPEQRSAIAKWRTDAKADPFLLGKGDDASLAQLDKAFQGDPEAAALLAEIRSSRAIYRPFLGMGGTGYEANLARETGMKRNFQRQFETAERQLGKPPKVFLKFGGYHAMRGMSGTDVPSFANFLAEWGGSRGLNMVNLMVDCLGGSALNPQSQKAEPCESYFGKDAAIVRASAGGPPIQVYDFKSLRPTLARQKAIDPETRRAILAFDYYVVVRDGVAATPIGDLSGR